MSRDATLAKVEMDQMYASHDGIVMQSCLPSCVPLAQSGGVYNADGITVASTQRGIIGDVRSGTDHAFWFWENVF